MFCFPSDKVQHEIQRRRLINISRKKNETKPLFKVNRKFCGRSVVHLEEDLGEDGVKVEPLACIRRSVWCMLYADDAGFVSKSVEGLAKMMIVIVTGFEAAGFTVSETKTETMLRGHPTRQSGPHRSSSKQRARGICRQCSFCTWAALSTQAPTLCQR